MAGKYRKIVVLDSVIFFPEHRARLERIADQIIEYPTCETEQEVLERVAGADCIISCWVDVPNSVIDRNPQLKTIAFWTHAFEHRIDKDYALKKNIHVPCIPDYGTDSVAELAFIGLLQLYASPGGATQFRTRFRPRSLAEAVMAKIAGDARCFHANAKAVLDGSWTHEYIKSGKLRISNHEYFSEETLKGLTLGLLVSPALDPGLITHAVNGFRMNAVYCCGDLPHHMDVAFRPLELLLDESHVLVFDSRSTPGPILERIRQGRFLSTVDLAGIDPSRGNALNGRKLGIVGLGRIGSRVAQIAREGFSMDVHYHSRRQRPDLEASLGIRPASLQDVLAESDIVTFHLPHVGAEGAITNELLSLIPPQTTLVNVSAGNIFADQAYMLRRFADGDLNGYIDVFETLPPRRELRERKAQLLSSYRLGWRTKSTIGLKTHKLISRLEEGLHV